MNITVHIEQLIIDGPEIPYSQKSRLKKALEIELARLLAADGLSQILLTGGTVSGLRGGILQLADEQEDPGILGRKIAQAVYGGIGR